MAELAHPCTRRSLLSLIMSIFDPFSIPGFVAPEIVYSSFG